MDIEKIILAELNKSKANLHEISRATGLNPSVICRFRQGKTLTARNAGKLLAFFGYDIIKRKGVKP